MATASGHFNLTMTSQPLHHHQRQYYSPWQSPIPYLFGGLAAMCGLVALVLLVLACFYWRLSGQFDVEHGDRREDIEAGEWKDDGVDAGERKGTVPEEAKVVVIMAGKDTPTFLAKVAPMWSGRAPYISEGSSCRGSPSFGRDDTDIRLGNETGEIHSIPNVRCL